MKPKKRSAMPAKLWAVGYGQSFLFGVSSSGPRASILSPVEVSRSYSIPTGKSNS